MGGLGFNQHGLSDICMKDLLRIRFVLDNKGKSEIEREIIVRNISNGFFGCEFTGLGPYEQDLGFYLIM
jgi:hypothetical protein